MSSRSYQLAIAAALVFGAASGWTQEPGREQGDLLDRPPSLNGSFKPVQPTPPSYSAPIGIAGPPRVPGVSSYSQLGTTAGQGVRTRRRARVVWETQIEPIPTAELQRQNQIEKFVKQLEDVEEETKRESIAANLRAELEKVFDEDLARREEEFAKVEKRVARLRSQLDKRKAARDKILDLRVTTLILDAQGLSFPVDGRSSPGGPGTGSELLQGQSRPTVWIPVDPMKPSHPPALSAEPQ